ncbi:MAG TPA: hypothetical protein VG675_24740 [Bryobacteraceae bacterium]|nr:hypothetical protein [Bryobacteraceae bacterium]
MRQKKMSRSAVQDPRLAIGRAPERLTLQERLSLTGKYIALEIYTPKSLPYRRIEAIGDSAEACAALLRSRGLDPKLFEYSRLEPPY